MNCWVFILSHHHLNMALALSKRNPKRDFIFISGKPQSDDFIKRIPTKIKYLQTKEDSTKGFFSVEKKYKEIVMTLKNMDDPDEIITFYDTFSGFSYLKHIFRIKWSQVSLIEDGLANFIAISMPSFFNRAIKASINFFLNRYLVPTSFLSLGHNKHICKIYSSWPEKVSVHNSMKIINIRKEYEEVLDSLSSNEWISGNNLSLNHMDIVMIPPLLTTRNLSKKKIFSFLSDLFYLLENKAKIYIKLHPSEGTELQEFIEEFLNLKSLSVSFLSPKTPIEYYFANLKTFSLTGSPSTSHLIAVNNFSKKLIGDAIIIPDYSNPFSKKHLGFLGGIKRLKISEVL